MKEHTFFKFGSKLLSTAFQVSAVELDKALFGNNVREFEHTKLSYGIYENISFPVVFKHEYGKKLCDIIGTGWACLYLISDKLRDLLTEHNLSGWKTFPVKIYDKKDNEISGYHGFSAFGRSGMIDYSKCTFTEKRLVPTGPIDKYYKGATINPEEWDGSDFFLPGDNGRILVSEQTLQVLKKYKLSNVVFERLVDVEIDSYTYQLDSRQSHMKKKES